MTIEKAFAEDKTYKQSKICPIEPYPRHNEFHLQLANLPVVSYNQ
jgi:hypothetical protein